MKQPLQLKLVTPAAIIFEQAVERVILPTTTGQITVLPEHTDLVSILEPGELIVHTATEQFPLAVAGGVLEVYGNTLYVLVDAAEHASDIDIAAAEQQAQQLEQQLKTQTDLDLSTYSILVNQLEHQRIRAQIGKKWRKL